MPEYLFVLPSTSPTLRILVLIATYNTDSRSPTLVSYPLTVPRSRPRPPRRAFSSRTFHRPADIGCKPVPVVTPRSLFCTSLSPRPLLIDIRGFAIILRVALYIFVFLPPPPPSPSPSCPRPPAVRGERKGEAVDTLRLVLFKFRYVPA
ncbi:hypothetical protein ACG7TL_005085 [Trametes sanguinea]